MEIVGSFSTRVFDLGEECLEEHRTEELTGDLALCLAGVAGEAACHTG